MFKHVGMQPLGAVETLLQLNRVKFFNFRNGEKILDFGGGDGNVWSSVYKSEKNLIIDLFEPDKELEVLAKDKNIYTNFYNLSSDINKSLYDSVTCFGVMEHVENVKELLDDLNGFKKIHIVVPNANSFHRQVGVEKRLINNIYELSENDFKVGHKKYYDKGLLLKDIGYLLELNYKIKKFGTVSFKFLDNKNTESYIDLFNEINLVAERQKLIGENFFNGAELAISLEKTEN